jgi:APA family basic amino acid/polyamine antiporter
MVITASFDSLLIYIGFILSIFATLTVFGMKLIRKTRPDLVTAYRTFGYPLTPLLFIGGNLWIIIYMIKSRPVSVFLGLCTIVSGLMIYLFFLNFRPQVALKKNTGAQSTFVPKIPYKYPD